ncbi:MAG: sigma-54 dependent transcriptional regulator [Gemmatimonadota bacterium]
MAMSKGVSGEAMRILIVDDDVGLRRSTSLLLGDEGHEVHTAANGREGLDLARELGPELILVDVRMPVMDGLEFLEAYRGDGGEAPVVVTTAYGSMELAVEAMKRGAYDYLAKPFGRDEMILTVRKAQERERLRREVTRLRSEVPAGRWFGDVVARSPEMVRVVELTRKVAPHPTSVLLVGATGTGKELLARILHTESPRADGPFVAVNCGAVPETLLESEFFGYAKGAFSGADRDREGLLAAAHGGTLFLDEVGELPEQLQVKLLRALQEREVRRLGESRSRSFDARVVSATNRPLQEEVDAGRFRKDFYFRLAVVTIEIPPLRERPDDLAPLVELVLGRLNRRLRRDPAVTGVEPSAMELLARHSWPGNVRELENVLERAVILTEGSRIRVPDLPPELRGEKVAGGREVEVGADGSGDLSVKRNAARMESELIRLALERTGGHRGRAAKLLELSDRALRYKIRDYGLEPGD